MENAILAQANWNDIEMREAAIAAACASSQGDDATMLNFVRVYAAIFVHEFMHYLGYLDEGRINAAVRAMNRGGMNA